MTATSRPRRASKDVQSPTLGPALRGLGLALGTSATPRLDFRRELRLQLIQEARLLALRPKPPPRSRRSRGGGIRLAAIGVGFSLAGGGVVAAAHSFSLPAKATAPVSRSTPQSPNGISHALPGDHGAVTGAAQPVEQVVTSHLNPPPTPQTATATPGPAVPASSAVGPISSGLLPTPAAVLSTQAPSISVAVAPPFRTSHKHAPPVPTLLPTRVYPGPTVSAGPSPSQSPLG